MRDSEEIDRSARETVAATGLFPITSRAGVLAALNLIDRELGKVESAINACLPELPNDLRHARSVRHHRTGIRRHSDACAQDAAAPAQPAAVSESDMLARGEPRCVTG